MNDLTLITTNLGKVKQVSNYLKIPVKHQNLELDELQSLDLAQVINHKVKQAYSQIKKPVLVDDVALTITGFGKLPGPFIKWFLQELGAEKICEMSKGQSVVAEVAIGFYDGKSLQTFIGSIKGKIADKPKGENGFGWDKIVIPDGFTKTRGQMLEKDYDYTSPRRMALEKLRKYLDK